MCCKLQLDPLTVDRVVINANVCFPVGLMMRHYLQTRLFAHPDFSSVLTQNLTSKVSQICRSRNTTPGTLLLISYKCGKEQVILPPSFSPSFITYKVVYSSPTVDVSYVPFEERVNQLNGRNSIIICHFCGFKDLLSC